MTQSIERYLNVRQAYFPAPAQDGKHVAFLTDITGVPQVWQTEVATGGVPSWPDQLTFGADRVLGVWASPAPDDDRLIFARDAGGNENAQLFLLDGEDEQPLTPGYPEVMHTFGEWSADGMRILFAANRRRTDCFDLYVQPIGGEARMVWQNDERGYLQPQSFSPDGRRAAFARTPSAFKNDLFEVDLDTGEARNLTPVGEDVRFGAIEYTPDGRSLLVTTDRQSDFLYIARIDLDTMEIERIVAVEWDIEMFAQSPDGQLLAYVVNHDGVSKLNLLDRSSGVTRTAPSPSSSPGVIGFFDEQLRFSADSKRLMFSASFATRASDIYVWDLETDRVGAVTRSSHGGLNTTSFVAPQLIRFPTFDDRQIPAWYFEPRAASDEPRPAVVVVHGGPEAQALPTFNFLVQYLIGRGYTVLVPNVRGSTGYGKAYSHLDDREQRMDSVADLAHAAHWLQEQPRIDSQRLVVYGGSYGGFMVLASLTTNPELWAAGVDIVGISNFRTFLENTSEYRRAHREAEYGSLEHDRDFLENIAPINHVDNIRAPLMVIHGANDPRVPLSEAEQLVDALRRRTVPVELLVFDDEGHGIVKLKNKLVAFPAIVDFLRQHV